MAIKGRDMTSGLPKEIIIDEADIREALLPSLFQIIEAVKEILEMAPPEVLGDILRDGIALTGGGALIKNIDKLFEAELKVNTYISDTPLTDVVKGAELILNNMEKFEEFIIKDSKSNFFN